MNVKDHNDQYETVSDLQMLDIKEQVIKHIQGELDEYIVEYNAMYGECLSLEGRRKGRKAIRNRVTKSLNLQSKYDSKGNLRSK